MLNINPPPSLRGTEQAQLTQVYRYLFQLSEQLNVAMSATEQQIQQKSAGVVNQTTIVSGGSGGVTDTQLNSALENQYDALTSIIQQTADIVNAEMDALETTLKASYEALSKDWGVYKEEISREILDTAEGTVEKYIYSAKVESLTPGEEAEFEKNIEGFIVKGIIGFDENHLPIIGIAIGRELLKKKSVVGGKTYEVIDTSKDMTTYTADRLSFWINGVETAYFSNSELVVTRIKIADSIELGDWLINVNAVDGMSIQQRIGSELDLSTNPTITLTADHLKMIAEDIDLSANGQFTVVANKAESANKVYRQEEFPSGEDGVKANDMLVIPSTGAQYQAVEAKGVGLEFVLDAEGNLWYKTSNVNLYSVWVIDGEIYTSGFAVNINDDGEIGDPFVWATVRDSANLTKGEFETYMRLDNGLHIGEEGSQGEVVIDKDSVDVMFGGKPYSSFGKNYVEFGNYQLRRTADGGLCFKLR